MDWSDTIVDMNLTKPSATNTPQPSATNTPSPNPSSTPVPTVKPSATPTPKLTTKPTSKTTPTPTEEDDEVLGMEDEITPSPTIVPTDTPAASDSSSFLSNTKSRNAVISLLFVGAGTGLLSAVLFGKKLRGKIKKVEE